MDDEIEDLHQQIKNLMNEPVGRKSAGTDSAKVRRMSAGERRLLVRARWA